MIYNYTKEVFDINRLIDDVRISGIVTALDNITALGSNITITFKADLSVGDETLLNDVVTNHTGEPMPDDFVQKIEGEVTPRAAKNEYSLRPYGLGHKHINAAEQIFDITIVSVDGKNLTYSDCGVTPQFYDCISQDHAQTRDGISSVNEGVITTFLGRLIAGPAKLTRPVPIDYKLEYSEDNPKIYLWGIFIDAEDNGEDDMVRLQFVDIDGDGIEIGLYDEDAAKYGMTPTDFFDYAKNAQGGAVILKEYDECWVRHLNGVIEVGAPDNSPGGLYKNLVLRTLYYCKDITKTNIRVWNDYKLTIKDD